MTALGLILLRASGRLRLVLVVACTALVSALLLVCLTMLLLPDAPREALFDVVADPGTRGGAAFATALLVVPPLLLLHQAVRLGTAARERRLAGLRVAGATPGEVRRLAAVEVGLPALLGGVLGLGVYAVLRTVFGGGRVETMLDDPGSDSGYRVVGSGLGGLVPTSVTPSWWQVLLLVVLVGLLGALVGLRAGRDLVLSPHGVSRRQRVRAPRPWGFLLLVLAAAVGFWLPSAPTALSTVLGILVVALAVAAVAVLAPWAAYRVGRVVADRATTAAVLLAARRLVVDPRPAGRASAAVGGIALVAGGAAGIGADVLGQDYGMDPFYRDSLVLVGVCLVGALVVVCGTLAVHSAESLVDRKRSIASLRALGAPLEEVERSQRWEAGLVALPMALVGAVLGTAAVALIVSWSPAGAALVLAVWVVTPALVWLAVWIAVRLTRPVVVRAAGPESLRTA